MTRNTLQPALRIEGHDTASRREDRRTRYTKAIIHRAFFDLLREKGFDRVTVTDICKRSDINRGTFYLHYDDKYALLDEVIDEALDAGPILDGTQPTSMCQRPPENDDYRLLYTQPELFSRVTQHVIERSAPEAIPQIMQQTGLSEQDARALFVFTANGNLAINRALGWQRNAEFAHVQELLTRFIEAGYRGV